MWKLRNKYELFTDNQQTDLLLFVVYINHKAHGNIYLNIYSLWKQLGFDPAYFSIAFKSANFAMRKWHILGEEIMTRLSESTVWLWIKSYRKSNNNNDCKMMGTLSGFLTLRQFKYLLGKIFTMKITSLYSFKDPLKQEGWTKEDESTIPRTKRLKIQCKSKNWMSFVSFLHIFLIFLFCFSFFFLVFFWKDKVTS